jgi:hypothetical protein
VTIRFEHGSTELPQSKRNQRQSKGPGSYFSVFLDVKPCFATCCTFRFVLKTNLAHRRNASLAPFAPFAGITSRDAAVRFAEHRLAIGTGREFLDYSAVENFSTKIGVRVWEQTQINLMKMQKNGGQLLNRRNEIAPKYWGKYGL